MERIWKMGLILDPELDRSYIEQLCDIDRISFQSEPFQNALEWAKQKPWMYSVLRRGNDVLGYTLIMPLRKNAYESIKKGRMWETEISVIDIDNTHPEGFYLASIASARITRNRFPFINGILCGIAGGQLERASLEIMAIPVTRVGQKITTKFKN